MIYKGNLIIRPEYFKNSLYFKNYTFFSKNSDFTPIQKRGLKMVIFLTFGGLNRLYITIPNTRATLAANPVTKSNFFLLFLNLPSIR